MQQETSNQRQEGRDQSAASDAQRSIPTSDEGTRRRNQSVTRRTEGRDSRGRALRVGNSWLPTPWALMRRLSEELEQLVDSTAAAPADGRTGAQYGRRSTDVVRSGSATSAPALDVWAPSTEVIERPDAIVVRADLPGLTPDDVEVTVQDNVLTISGERRQENQRATASSEARLPMAASRDRLFCPTALMRRISEPHFATACSRSPCRSRGDESVASASRYGLTGDAARPRSRGLLGLTRESPSARGADFRQPPEIYRCRHCLPSTLPDRARVAEQGCGRCSSCNANSQSMLTPYVSTSAPSASSENCLQSPLSSPVSSLTSMPSRRAVACLSPFSWNAMRVWTRADTSDARGKATIGPPGSRAPPCPARQDGATIVN